MKMCERSLEGKIRDKNKGTFLHFHRFGDIYLYLGN